MPDYAGIDNFVSTAIRVLPPWIFPFVSEAQRASSDAEHIRNYLTRLVNEQTQSQQEKVRIDFSEPLSVSAHDQDRATVEAANRLEVERLLAGYTQNDRDTLLMITESLTGYRNGNRLATDFVECVREKMSICLHPDWNGNIKIQGKDGAMYPYPVEGTEASNQKVVVWSVYSQQNNNQYSWVADYIDHDDVEALTSRLRLIDALFTEDAFEKSKKLTHLNKDKTIGNLDSTQQESSIAMDKSIKITQTGAILPAAKLSPDTASLRLYLIVSYVEKEQAKAVGARWDKAAKSWYVDQDKVDLKAIEQWLPKNAVKNVSIDSPQEQFTQSLCALGADTNAQQIIMNGKKHRIRVPGDKGQEKSGVYFGHLDGKPAGYFKNFRTNTELRWKFDGVELTDSQKQVLITEAEERIRLRREAESQAQQDSAKAAVSNRNY